jgi:flagellar assembly protein FliH
MNKKIIKNSDVSLESNLEMSEAVINYKDPDSKVIKSEDIQTKNEVNKILNKALRDAKKIKEKAKELYMQVEAKTEESRLAGFDVGKEEGKALVTETLIKLQKQNEVWLKELEKESISLIYEIAQKVIGNELKTNDQAILGMIKQALQSSMGTTMTIYLNGKDHERIKDKESQLVSSLDAMQKITLKVAENVHEGGCVIESELGTIDAHLDYQLNAIKRALGLYVKEEL